MKVELGNSCHARFYELFVPKGRNDVRRECRIGIF